MYAIAKELGVGTPETVRSWQVGKHRPRSIEAVIKSLRELKDRKDVPPKRRWRRKPG